MQFCHQKRLKIVLDCPRWKYFTAHLKLFSSRIIIACKVLHILYYCKKFCSGISVSCQNGNHTLVQVYCVLFKSKSFHQIATVCFIVYSMYCIALNSGPWRWLTFECTECCTFYRTFKTLKYYPWKCKIT